MSTTTSVNVGTLPTVVIRAPPIRMENYEWQIRIPPKFLSNVDFSKQEIDLGHHEFLTGSISKCSDPCVLYGFLSKKAAQVKLQISCRMPAKDGETKFRMKPYVIDLMEKARVLKSKEQEINHDGGGDGWEDDDEIWGRSFWESSCDLSDHVAASPSMDRMKITFFIEIKESAKAETINFDTFDYARRPFSSMFSNFFNSRLYSDINICCQEKEFPAHRVVLSAASTVFSRMLQTDMKEKREGKIEINDVEAKTMELMLKWIYGEQLDFIEFNDLVAILKLSHQFHIDPLKKWCALKIACHYLHYECPLEIFALGETYGELQLMEAAKEAIAIDRQAIFQDQEVCDAFFKRYPGLMRDLLMK